MSELEPEPQKPIPPYKATASGRPPENTEDRPVPTDVRRDDGQHDDHWVLADREKPLVRPMRDSYRHEKCGTTTRMPQKCAETYAINPSFYGSTFCCTCGDYFPVGAEGEFVWLDDGKKVGI